MDPFERKLVTVFEREPGFDRIRSLMVAVSGGPDSVALLVSLCRLSCQLGVEIKVAHVNHGLRGEESDADQRFVGQLCRDLGVHLDVNRLGPLREKGNLEEQMRIGRYQSLYEMAEPDGTAVATAHHADDQAETILLKLIRGSGLAGLSGIYPIMRNKNERVCVIRPLLGFRKAEILDYLKCRNVSFRTDSSNLSTGLDRNWVRQVLLPQVVERLNRRAVEHLCHTATLAREAEALMKSLSASILDEVVVSGSSREVAVDIPRLSSQPVAFRRRLLREAVLLFDPGLRALGFEPVQSILDLSENPNGHRIELPRGVVAVRQDDQIVIRAQGLDRSFSYLLPVPGRIHIESLSRTVSVENWEDGAKPSEVVKFGFSPDALMVRNRRPGDVFCTRSGRPRKLKKLFNDKQIPINQRDRLIVVLWGEKIIWVEKLWPHPEYRNDETPTVALRIVDYSPSICGG